MPRLARSNIWKSARGRSWWNQFHFHWLMHSATGPVIATRTMVVKKARKVLRVMSMGRLGSSFPSKAARTLTMTVLPVRLAILAEQLAGNALTQQPCYAYKESECFQNP